MAARAEETLRDVLAGAPGLVRGITYVPPELLAVAMHVSEADALQAACAAMELEFAFVSAEHHGAAESARALAEAGVASFWSVPGPLGILAEKTGWRRLLMDTIEDPRGLGSALDEACNALL